MSGVSTDPFDDTADGDAAGSAGGPGLVGVEPGHAGDVEVQPGRVADEFLEEHGRVDGSAVAGEAGVLDVGDGGADLLAVLVLDGQAPEFFAGDFEGFGEMLVGVLIVGEDT